MAATRAILVTGASTGIGRACALYLDKQGFKVFAGVRREADGAALQRQATPQLTPVYIDVTKADSIKDAAHTVRAVVGRQGLAGLVNNAGIAIGGPLEFLPINELRRQFEINVIGQVAVTQAFLSLLRLGCGRVVNMSSISGRIAMPFVGPYASSKFALEALTDSLRLELHPWGVKVISIEPGAVATPIWDKSLAKAEETLAKLPPEARDLYAVRLSGLREVVLKTGQTGLPAEKVAEVVAHALTVRRPKTRYPVGRDAMIGVWLGKFLPDRLRDWFIMQASKRRGVV